MNPPASDIPDPAWREIPDFPLYQVSVDGRIRNRRNGLIRVPDVNSRGYLRIRVQKENKYYRLMIHRCVARAFIPNPFNKKCVDHIDNNILNNRLENLRWTTHSENSLNTKLRENKKHSIYKNILKRNNRYIWRVIVNGVCHQSPVLFQTEEEAHTDFVEKAPLLSEYISLPIVNAIQTSESTE
jgi:hypothetical protein